MRFILACIFLKQNTLSNNLIMRKKVLLTTLKERETEKQSVLFRDKTNYSNRTSQKVWPSLF